MIYDIRCLEMPPSLDDYGFMFRHRPSRLAEFSDKDQITSTYLPEVEDIINTELDNVEKVFIFDWRLRRAEDRKESDVIDLNDPMDWLLPAMHTHVDQSPLAVLRRIQLQFPDAADTLLRGRVRVINVWRPIQQTVTDWPLAFCDGRTVSDSDLIESDHIRRHYVGSTMYLLDKPNHRWYYTSNQKPDEAKYTPHAAFKQGFGGTDNGGRASIEVRALVFGPP
ncbi:hypothetical protein F4804DRAFT_352110 [Jackrogersella minutella]|nr:hypothetical protein F4804DRAFT_352110 [Jackrogersella minutella]